MTIRKGTNIIIGQVPTDTSITSTGIYPVTGAAIYTALGLKANDSSVMHKAGTETVTGNKTFTTQLTRSGNLSSGVDVIVTNDTGNKGYTKIRSDYANSSIWNRLISYNSTSGITGALDVIVSDTGVVSAALNVAGTGVSVANNNASSSTSDGLIALRGWVNDSTKSTNVVHRSGDETISGCKSFSGGDSISSVGMAPINIVDINPDGTTAGTLQYKDIIFGDTNSIRIGVIRAGVDTANRRQIGLNVCSNTNTNLGGITISCAADGTDVKCNLPAETYGTNFHGTADYAKWADLAECYKPDQKYSVGTLIKFGGEKDITIANDKCNGVISDKPGFVLDAELEDSQPIALVGKTPIRVIGKVKKFDKIVLSEIPGVGRVLQENEDKQVIARALENNDTFEEKLVMCVTKFNLD